MINKTLLVRNFAKAGQYKKAIAIAAGFRLGMTTEQRRLLQIAKDVINGNGLFYEQIGVDIQSVLQQAEVIVREKYLTEQKYEKDFSNIATR